jgi:hypothetical protein
MRHRRIELLMFFLAWVTYAYFHQGGGWNQNGRFALTRALVEKREPWIDDYLVYTIDEAKGSPALLRIPLQNGSFTYKGQPFALGWYNPDGSLAPLAPETPQNAHLVPAQGAGVTGDLAFARGHTHPNKAPGTSFAAVPGYAVVFGLERLFGIDPDAAGVLSVNAWLSGVLSVGLVAALGVVLFWRLALRLSGGRGGAASFATTAFAFGTLYFPYATMLYEHDLVVAALLGGFLLALDRPTLMRLFGAGVCAGAAIVASYLSVVAAAILGGYIVSRGRRAASVAAYVAGMVPPLLFLAAYNLACFGRLVTTNYAWENPLFKKVGGGVLDLFAAAPRWNVVTALLVSPYRGLFSGTPVLVLGVIGLVSMLRHPRLRPEGILCAAMVAYVFLFNASFTGWDAGWACGPRYLIPALPFLALPIVFVGSRAAWARHALLAVSIAAMGLATAVDPQTPAESSAWGTSPIWGIDLPQLIHGRPGAYGTANWPQKIIAMYTEPVSANPGGVYSGLPGRFFSLDSPQCRWNSFNVGEFLFPGSRFSLLPWLGIASVFVVLLWRESARSPQRPV